MTQRRCMRPVLRPGRLESLTLRWSQSTFAAFANATAILAAWPVAALAPLGALTALAGCTLAADLDSLTAKRRHGDDDGGTAAGPVDARSNSDAPAVLADGSVAAREQDAPVAVDVHSVAADAPAADGVPEDSATGDDRPGDAPPADVTESMDSGRDDEGRDGGATATAADAAVTLDGPAVAVIDGSADALLMCPRSPSQYAALHLMNSNSTTTSCGYARAGLSGPIAGVDSSTFAASGACGACVRVETAAAVVVAEVVDQGPRPSGGNPSAISLNRAALTLLVPDGSTFVEQGVSWRFVACPLPSAAGMTFQFQDGSSSNYAALLVENHRFRLASVEYWSNGRYRPLARATYNYWVATSGMGGGPFTLRITDVHGHAVEQTGVPLRPGATFRGQAQFPECANN